MITSVPEILGLVSSLLQALGITPYIQAGLAIIVAIAAVARSIPLMILFIRLIYRKLCPSQGIS